MTHGNWAPKQFKYGSWRSKCLDRGCFQRPHGIPADLLPRFRTRRQLICRVTSKSSDAPVAPNRARALRQPLSGFCTECTSIKPMAIQRSWMLEVANNITQLDACTVVHVPEMRATIVSLGIKISTQSWGHLPKYQWLSIISYIYK